MKSDLEYAIECSKRLEYLLEHNFGATGRGLHQKVNSVAEVLDPQTVRDLRYIATIRNRLVHEDGISTIDDREEFTAVFSRLEESLSQAPSTNPFNAASTPDPEYDEWEDFWGTVAFGIGATAFAVTAIFKLPFIVSLIFGFVGLFLGYWIKPILLGFMGFALFVFGASLIVYVLYLIHEWLSK